MKKISFFLLFLVILSSCKKKKKDEATVGLPFKIESLSKNSVRQNDTLVLRGYILDQGGVNDTKIYFQNVIGTVLRVSRDSVVVIVPQTISGFLTLKQNRNEAYAIYTYIP